jgi:thiol-disulfide isomerase/thioredoxin
MKKLLTTANIFNGALIILFLAMIFVPSAKALLQQGLMKIGFLSPHRTSAGPPLKTTSGIKFRDTEGKVVDLGNLKGKIVFLNFWASWCPPCIAEIPAINKLYEKFKDDADVVFILADADGNLIKSQKFMDGKKFRLPIYAVASQIPEALYQGSLPTTVVFDKQGHIAYNEIGAANYGDPRFIEFINKLKTTN